LATPLAGEGSPDEADACENAESASPPSARTVPESGAGVAVRPMTFETGRCAAGCGVAAALSAAAETVAGVAFAAEAAGRAAEVAGADTVRADGPAVAESEVSAGFDSSDALGVDALGFAATTADASTAAAADFAARPDSILASVAGCPSAAPKVAAFFVAAFVVAVVAIPVAAVAAAIVAPLDAALAPSMVTPSDAIFATPAGPAATAFPDGDLAPSIIAAAPAAA
jgi:hypothetical protein